MPENYFQLTELKGRVSLQSRTFFKLLFLIVIPGLALSYSSVQGQSLNPVNSWFYLNQATQFGDFGTPHDPVSLVMPATAYTAGLGTFLDNPASTALFGASFIEVGYSGGGVNEEISYATVFNREHSSDFQSNLSNAGFVYSFPMDIGHLVVGGGYMEFANYNRSISISGRNNISSITDFLKTPGGLYSDIAFNTFATDFGDEFQDWNESIFRIGFENFGEYPGISQVFTITELGRGGEYSVFASTEFRRNLMIGISLGWVRGNYMYKRDFLEIDALNIFDGEFIDTNGDGEPDTDIDRVSLEDRRVSSFDGLRIRVGVLYRFTPFINAGLSYSPSATIRVEEQLNANVSTLMNNRVRLEDDKMFDMSYRFKTPSKMSIGIALDRYYRFSLSMAADYVNFKQTELIKHNSELIDFQLNNMDNISNALKNVWNIRTGISYDVRPRVTLRGGYANLSGQFESDAGNKSVYSIGTGVIITSRILFDMAFQIEKWQESSSVYDFAEYDYTPLPEATPNFTLHSENAERQVNRWQMFASVVVFL